MAILENAKEPCIHEVVNGEYTLEFQLPITDSKWQYVVEENLVKVDGQLFVIKNISDEHGEEALCTVTCEHVFFLLLDEHIEAFDFEGTAVNALSAILTGTEHSVGVVDVTGSNSTPFETGNPVKAVNKLISVWGGEIKADNFTVDLLTHRGSTTPNIQFRYRKNMKNVVRNIDTTGLVTRLYVYGNNGLTIEDAAQSGGLKYIDSQYINNYRRPKTGSMTFDIDDVDELYAAGVKYLTTVEVPFVSYEVDVIELKGLAGYGENEAFFTGDEAMVFDEVLGITVQARILDYKRYPRLEDAYKSKVVLANFRPGIHTELSQLRDLRNQLITQEGSIKVSTAWFEGLIDILKNQLIASGSYATAQVIEDKGFLLENININSPDYGAFYIGPGIFAIANEKTGSPPSWNWRTWGTGAGIVADHVSASGITAGNLTLTDLLKIVSEDGNLEISGTELSFAHENGTESRLTSTGLLLYDDGVVQPYISTIEGGTILNTAPTGWSGNEDTGYWFLLSLRGNRWVGKAANVKLIVQPAIQIRFYNPEVYRDDGIKQYACKEYSVTDVEGGIDIWFTSWEQHLTVEDMTGYNHYYALPFSYLLILNG